MASSPAVLPSVTQQLTVLPASASRRPPFILSNIPTDSRAKSVFPEQVRDLARLSLRQPEYLAVHADAGAPTPAKLQQAVMEVPLPQKLDALWSFIKSHLKVRLTASTRSLGFSPSAGTKTRICSS